MIERLSSGEATVSELAEPFSMTQPAITKHLKVLERAELVTRSRNAQRRPARLNPARLVVLIEWIERYRKVWEANFDRLDQVLNDFTNHPKEEDPV